MARRNVFLFCCEFLGTVMGNALHWAIFLLLALICIVLVLYSLLGKFRSILIAIPIAGVFAVCMYFIVMTQRIPRPYTLTIFLLVGSTIGFLRQFRRRISRYDLKGERDQ